MKLSPFMKKVEIEGGYRGFYKIRDVSFTVTVDDRGVLILIDTCPIKGLSTGTLSKFFKPISGLIDAKIFAESIGEADLDQLIDLGFVEIKNVTI